MQRYLFAATLAFVALVVIAWKSTESQGSTASPADAPGGDDGHYVTDDPRTAPPYSFDDKAAVFPYGGESCLVSNNVRNADTNVLAFEHYPVERPWSLSAASFPLVPIGASQPYDYCATVAALQAAIRLGERAWDEGAPAAPLERELRPSAFRPYGCAVPYYTKDHACAVLSKYSQVVLIGDSLTRHLYMAFLIVASGDLERGGYPAKRPRKIQKAMCRCDGMFSEAPLCRMPPSKILPKLLEGDCKLITRVVRSEAPHSKHDTPLRRLDKRLRTVCDGDPTVDGGDGSAAEEQSRKLFVLQTAAHLGTNATTVEDYMVRPIMSRILEAAGRCKTPPRLDFVWMSAGTQSRLLDEKFPNQSSKSAALFNRDIEQFIKDQNYPNQVVVFDWQALTKEAPKSDGFHYLQDTYMAQVFVLLRMMEIRG